MDGKLCVYKCADSIAEIDYRIELPYWLQLIKESNKTYPRLLDDISYVRGLDRKDQLYKQAKATLLPAICLHSQDGRLKADIQSLTGYVFVDFDKQISEAQLIKARPHIIAQYTSPGGSGTHIILRVDGMTISNFNAEYKLIMQELGLDSLYDPKVAYPHNLTYVSLDPAIYINFEALPFNASKLTEFKGGVNPYPNTVSFPHIRERFDTPPHSGVTQPELWLDYNQANLLIEVDQVKKYKIIEEGMTYLKANIPYKRKSIKIGSRGNALKVFGFNLKGIYSDIDKVTLSHHMTYFADSFFEVDMSKSEVRSTIDFVWTKTDFYTKPAKTKNKDKNYVEHNRKIWWGYNVKYKKGEKQKLTPIALAELHRTKTKEKISHTIEILQNSDCSVIISKKAFTRQSGLAYNTVKKYWEHICSEFEKELSLRNNNK